MVLAALTGTLLLPVATGGSAGASTVLSVYVDGTNGDDSWSCTEPTPTGGTPSTDGPCRTIQTAIDKAADGATIGIESGTYAENLTIGKQVAILCVNSGISAGSAPGTRIAETVIRGEANITVAGVAIDGCTFARPDTNATSTAPRLIETIGVTGTVTIENSILDLTVFNTASDRGCGAALFGRSRWEAYDNEFRNQRYTGCTSGILYNSRTIMAEDGQGVVADGNLFNGTAQSILVTGSLDQNPATSITNNIFASNSAGPFLGRPRDVIIRGNTFEGAGIYLDSSTDTVIENNRFTGASYAVYAAGTHTGVEFRDNAVLGKYASSAGSPWAGRTLFNTGANPINAANNWWGQGDGPVITTAPTPDVVYQNPGLMPFGPWLAAYTEGSNPNEPYTTGFWPVAATMSNELQELILPVGAVIVPEFSSSTYAYSWALPFEVLEVSGTPIVPAGSGATITVNGTPVTSGSRTAPINLRTGVNTVTVVVSNGTQPSSTYVFTVDRSATPTFATVAPVTVPPTTSATRPAGPNQPGFNAASIRAEDVANIAPSQLRTIQPAQVNRLTPEAVAALNPAQVAAIPPAALTGLRPSQVSALPVAAVAALRPAQIAAIRPSAIAGLQPEQVAALPTRAVAALSPNQVAAFPPAAIASLQPQQLAAIPAAAIGAMRPAQLAAIPPTAFAAMTPRQVGTFSAAQARSVSPEQAAVLTPRQLRSLPASVRRILQNLAAEANENG